MALVAISDRQHDSVHILALTERHHIVSPVLSFVDFDLLLMPPAHTTEFRILIDHLIPPIVTVKHILSSSRPYVSSDFMQVLSDSGTINSEGNVYNLARSFRFGEGFNVRFPPYVRDPRPTRPSDFSITTEGTAPFTEIILSPTRGESWRTDCCYQFRIGFFISLPRTHWLRRHFPIHRYRIYVLSYDQQYQQLMNINSFPRITRGAELWIKMSPVSGLTDLRDILVKLPDTDTTTLQEHPSLHLSEYTYPQSDVTVITPRRWVVRRHSTRSDEEPGIISSEAKYVMYFSQKGASGFREFRWPIAYDSRYKDSCVIGYRYNDYWDFIYTSDWFRPIKDYALYVSSVGVGVSVAAMALTEKLSNGASAVLGVAAVVIMIGIYILIRRTEDKTGLAGTPRN